MISPRYYFLAFCSQMILFIGLLPNNICISAEPPTTASIVDYLKALSIDSSFENRAEFFKEKWPKEKYTGSADQNTKLLKLLLTKQKQILLPFPSRSVDGCEAFYSNPEVMEMLTVAFKKNAIRACIVTGTGTAENRIREKLQEAYLERKPKNGDIFSPEEHKSIHDWAYKAAGCKEESAHIWGWYVVDSVVVPELVIKAAIDLFGSCTISSN